MKKDELDQVGHEVVKRKKAGHPAMSPDLYSEIEPSVQQSIMEQSLTLMNLPDIDLMNVEQVQERIDFYFRLVTGNGNRPTVAGLGLALNGMDRKRLWEIRTGNFGNVRGMTTTLPQNVMDAIKKAYKVMEELWENYMQTGRINPVSGIFLGKNNFGYQDKQDVVITPNNPDADYSAKEIADRYALPPTDSDPE